jgi:hypothetical protein
MAKPTITNLIWDLGGTLVTTDLSHIKPPHRKYYSLLVYVYGGLGITDCIIL